MPSAEGTIFDRRGVPIFRGDLIKQPHFIDYRHKRHYLYHVVTVRDGYLEAVPSSCLEPTLRGKGGTYWITQNDALTAEVIHGHGPGDCLDFNDRPKRAKEKYEKATGDADAR